MFRAIILPIFRSTRLCVTVCGIMHRRCCRPPTSSAHYTTNCNTQSSAPEDGRNYRPKHVELIGIINKPLLLYLVCCLYYEHNNISFTLYATFVCCVILTPFTLSVTLSCTDFNLIFTSHLHIISLRHRQYN